MRDDEIRIAPGAADLLTGTHFLTGRGVLRLLAPELERIGETEEGLRAENELRKADDWSESVPPTVRAMWPHLSTAHRALIAVVGSGAEQSR